METLQTGIALSEAVVGILNNTIAEMLKETL
jgi:hypothetical protein